MVELERHPKSSGKLDDILLAFREGNIDLETARKELNLFSIEQISDMATLDPARQMRLGVPEVVYADTKSPEDAAEIALRLLEKNGYAFLTRARGEQHDVILTTLREKGMKNVKVHSNPRAGTILLKAEGFESPSLGGKVGIITAGTSDIPVAEEAKETCEFMGCEVISAYDVGIAGIHRLFSPLRNMIESGVGAIIVMAGMEGALPSVVCSLVDIPVIGVPCSVGYGYGGKGKAALMSMLQSCSPGLVVVNIDNGFGAGISAALIARPRC
ncbi:MAG: nickel pincer cofactor biosynthesis protein LarB [Thermoplasmata archaeon]|nr:nickel pincer cofactor biosynthesis protein LarB [Thermoplasmata archaeon]